MEQLHTAQNIITDEPQPTGNAQMPEAQQPSSDQIIEVINVSESDHNVTNISKVPPNETGQLCNTSCATAEAERSNVKTNPIEKVDKMDQDQIKVIESNTTNEIVDVKKDDIRVSAEQIQVKEEESIPASHVVKESEDILATKDQKEESVDCIDQQTSAEVKDVMKGKCTEINASLNSKPVPDPVCKVSQNEKQSLCTALSQLDQDNKDQNCTVIMETEVTKLESENSELVLLTVASVNEDTTNEDITIVEVEENNIPVDNENNQTTQPGEGNHEVVSQKDGLQLLQYTEESAQTVIEVISTEILNVQEDSGDSKDQVVKECSKTEPEESKVEILSESKDALSSSIIEFREEITEQQVSANDTNNGEEVSLNYKPKFCLKAEKDVPQSKGNSNNTVDKLKLEKAPTSFHENKNESQNKSRSVIQDIFDDWGVETPDDDIQTNPKVQDTVEIELKTLLDDTKTPGEDATKQESVSMTDGKDVPENITPADILYNSKKVLEKDSPSMVIDLEAEEKDVQSNQDASTSINKNQHNSTSPQNLEKATKNDSQNSHASQEPLLSSGTVVKTRNRHLTSHITSAAKVTEALKQRLKEKQKIVEPPKPDIFFVKKITQRLSSKLSGVPIHPVPALIPLSPTHPSSTEHSQGKSTEVIPIDIDKESKENDDGKESNSDNKELLAILEGDVDPDWSNLKPPILTEERKSPVGEHIEHPSPPKLDPLVERELALKQLLELPAMPIKKGTSKKKKTFKPAASKVSKEDEQKVNDSQEKVVVNLVSPVKESSADDSTIDVDLPKDLENSSPEDITVCSPTQDTRVDESRSGRKRKPTEKAREHEETTKRQKVYKGKVLFGKKTVTQVDISTDESSQESHTEKNLSEVENTATATTVKEVEPIPVEEKKTIKPETETKAQSPLPKTHNNKKAKQSMMKKGSQQISKRKMVMKKMMQKKMIPNKKSGNLKSKLTSAPKKSGTKVVSKSQKRPVDSTTGDAKPKKKIINEIDRLLQDEGVVNLLYDVEQPDKKRLIPITKSQAKVMDLQKAQRELKIRKKLVRNAVLRLRTTTAGSTKASPRSKRSSVHGNDPQTEKKATDLNKSVKASTAASTTEFIIPAKIRNAADASIIIRRHSSSSFSSASGSPRVSIDTPEKQATESVKTEDGILLTLRSNKRRHSQDENTKKAKKKAVPKADGDGLAAVVIENKITATTRSNKKTEPKKAEKKETETATVREIQYYPTGKVVTRSNGATVGKVTSKSRKPVKKGIGGKQDSNDDEQISKEEDKLSACLAEAATALSIVSSNRSGSSMVPRKGKGNAHTDLSGGKTKTETQCQFSNNEINVRRHGSLVQLILTPSSPTKIKNSLTLQVMHEFRETLSILKKDDECRVVLFTSTGTSFCEGLELSELLHTNKEERRVAAEEMANSVKEFVKCLATFNKPIVAGVQGAAVGLGVTMLPLFDLVIASDKATFSTPYGKLAQIAEGAAVFTLSHILGTAVTSELLLGGRTLTASEALRAGLVTRVLWPDRFQVELLPSLKVMSDQSSQSMEATKALLRHSLRKKLDAALESETYLLIQHWCSAECQSAIKDYIDGKVQ